MKTQALRDLVKAIKNIDLALWNVDPGENAATIRISRRALINIIFAEGYEITKEYRLIKSETQREQV